jgi:hypothetical protein
MTTTSVRTGVAIRVYARSIVYVANELIRTLQEIVIQRGLPLDYMHQNFEAIVNGFRTWILNRQLRSAVLEIWDSTTDRLVERYDLILAYQPSGTSGVETFETHMDKLKAFLAARVKPQPGCHYRVVANLEPGAPDAAGWTPTALRNPDHLTRQDGDALIETAKVGVQLAFYF